MTFDLQLALEAKVLTDVNATSGIQTQAYATCVLTTLRKGLTTLETAGYAAGACFCVVRLVWKKGAGDGIRASSALVLRCLPDEVVPGASSVKMKHHFDKPNTAVRLVLLEAPDCAPRRGGPGVDENEMPEEL